MTTYTSGHFVEVIAAGAVRLVSTKEIPEGNQTDDDYNPQLQSSGINFPIPGASDIGKLTAETITTLKRAFI
jgi:hypothetical protein